MPTTSPAERRFGIRGRLLVLVTAAIALGLVLAGALTYAVQRGQILDRIDTELAQEVDEVQARADRGRPDGGAYADVDSLMQDFLSFNVLSQDEAMHVFLGDGGGGEGGGSGDRSADLVAGPGERQVRLDEPSVVEAAFSRAVPGRTVLTTVRTDTQDLRLAVISISVGDTDGLVVLGLDRAERLDALGQLLRVYAAAALGALLLTAGALYLGVGRLIAPLGALSEATARIDHTDLTQRVEVPGGDRTEVTDLAQDVNRMLDRLEEAFRGQRQFLDDTAHELRTPLTIMRGNLEVLDPDDVEDVEATRDIEIAEVDRMRRIVDDLLTLARLQRPDDLAVATLDVGDLHRDLMALVPALGDREWVDDGTVQGRADLDRDRVVQAIQQLCANAVKFSGPGDRISLRTAWRGEGEVTLEVTDAGAGIDDEALGRIFERFDRGDSDRTVEGTGLGLTIVRAIAQAHGGTVEVESRLGVGSTFRLVLPTRRDTRDGRDGRHVTDREIRT